MASLLGLPAELRHLIVEALIDNLDFVALQALLKVSVVIRAGVQAIVRDLDAQPRCPFECAMALHSYPETTYNVAEPAQEKALVTVLRQLPHLRTLRIEVHSYGARQLAAALNGRAVLVDLTYNAVHNMYCYDPGCDLVIALLQARRLRSLYLHAAWTFPDCFLRWGNVLSILLSAAPPFHHLSVNAPWPGAVRHQLGSSLRDAPGLTAFRLAPQIYVHSISGITLCDNAIQVMERFLATKLLRQLDLAPALDLTALAHLADMDLQTLQSLFLTLHPEAGAAHAGRLLQNKPLLTSLTIQHVGHSRNKGILTFFPSTLTTLHIICEHKVGVYEPVMYLEHDIHMLAIRCPHLTTLSIPVPRLAGGCLSAITEFRVLRILTLQLIVTKELSALRCPCGNKIARSAMKTLRTRYPELRSTVHKDYKFASYLETAFHLCAIDHKLVYEIFQMVFARHTNVCELVISSCYDSYLGQVDSLDWMEALAATSRPHRMVGTVANYSIQRLRARRPEQVCRNFDLLSQLEYPAQHDLKKILSCLFTIWPKIRLHVPGKHWTVQTADLWADVITSLPVKFPVYSLPSGITVSDEE